jgi:hypothetical protein
MKLKELKLTPLQPLAAQDKFKPSPEMPIRLHKRMSGLG